ncbi:hypothetical protein LTR66_017454 [Elasticomyces elasticus]|nr:hypothetical protein LTR66_017454 [Elasticomyces elasticus]
MQTPSTTKRSISFFRPFPTDKPRKSESTPRLPPNRSLQSGHRASKRHDMPSTSKAAALRQRLNQMFGAGETTELNEIADRYNDEKQAAKEEPTVDVLCAKKTVPTHKRGNPSLYSLPLRDVPDRRSSLGYPRQASTQDLPSWRLPDASTHRLYVPSRDRAESPMRRVVNVETIGSDDLLLRDTRTFVRPTPPLTVLERGNATCKSIEMSMNLPSPLFIGGSTIEGQICLKIKPEEASNHKRGGILISKLSVDVLGIEEIADGRK